MDTELRIKQLCQSYNTLESHKKKKQSPFLDDPYGFKIRQEQNSIMKQVQELELSAD